MTHYAISATYSTCANGRVVFPEGKTWADVKDWYIKWDTLYALLEGETDYREFELHSDSTDGTDWKRPCYVSVYAEVDGEVDWDVEIASKE